MQNRKDILYCDLKNRKLIINNTVIHIPPTQFIIYLHCLKKKRAGCRFQEMESCKDCSECFETLFQIGKSSGQLLSLYKQLYGDYSERYQTLNAKLSKGQAPSKDYLLQLICKINRTIKTALNGNSAGYLISSEGAYGRTVYGIKHDKNKIHILKE